MFWGLSLKANRKYTQTVTKSFHISQAALDSSSTNGQGNQLFITSEDEKFLICTLHKDKCEQVALDLNFAVGDTVSFQTKGDGLVYLSGYLTDLPSEDYSDGEEEEDVEAELKENVKKTNGEEDEEDNSEEEEEEERSDESDSNSASDSDNEPETPKPKKAKLDKNGVGKKSEMSKNKKDKPELTQQTTNTEQTLTGGVIVKDIVIGNGTEIKSGKRAQVFYEGRLKSNNKVFDSMKQGKGFKFRVGQGEVIKGWDVGVVGMKIGGKRRITCPPHMAYGARGSPPQIPPNSTLVFEVELKGIN